MHYRIYGYSKFRETLELLLSISTKVDQDLNSSKSNLQHMVNLISRNVPVESVYKAIA